MSGAALAALSIVGVGTAVRMAIAVRQTDSPMIDENEVAEQAAAFLGPDQRFYFLKYGPLTMYGIAAIYRIVAAVRGLTPIEYASRVFFEGSEHYAIARVYTLGWLAVLALVAFAVLRRQVGARPGLLVASVLAFPLLEVLARGARIDIPQAAFQCLALLALCLVVERPRWGYWVAAGACAGLAVATKPLPGLLIAPSFLLASWFAAARRADGSIRPLLGRLGATFGAPGLWLAALVCVLCAIWGNPELLEIQRFIDSQRAAVALHSGNALAARSGIWATFAMLRVPFLASVGLAVALLALARDRRACVIGLFVVVYVSAFVGRASRTYFMVAPAAALCLLLGYGWARVEALLERWLARPALRRWLVWAWAPLAVWLVAKTTDTSWRHSLRENPVLEASRWMTTNIPSGSRIFHLGGRAYGTYLVSTDEKLQAGWGDHFEYGRYKYRFLEEAFHLAFENYMKSGQPRYVIEVREERALPRSTGRNKRWITDGLVRKAREKKQRYIILTGYRERDVHELGYKWFGDAILERQFKGLAIFRVPEQSAPVSAPAAVPAATPAP